jgi:hypothetical protein
MSGFEGECEDPKTHEACSYLRILTEVLLEYFDQCVQVAHSVSARLMCQ